jgi:hypothetical protein
MLHTARTLMFEELSKVMEFHYNTADSMANNILVKNQRK